MMRYAVLMTLAVVVAAPRIASAAEPRLAHVVYFKLKESTTANQEKLVDACREYLSGHEGTVYFAVGVLAEDLDREVNVKDFDVSLILVFRDKTAHAKYQKHPRHLKFIEENQSLWSGVRVFDSYIPVSANEAAAQ
ncbi:MAG: Dabb family protein [Planctomycetota bacterium]